MEIISKKNRKFRFRVLRPFHFDGRTVKRDEELEISEPEASGLVNIRKVAPIFPDVIECQALRGFEVPGRTEKFKCTKGERVLLKSGQAINLMVQHLCIPVDDDIWRPAGRQIKRSNSDSSWPSISKQEAPPFVAKRMQLDELRSLGIDSMQLRSSYFERARVDKGKRIVELSFSSEEPVERFWGIEILDHREGSVNLNRLKKSGPLLMDHKKDDQIGVIEETWIDSFLRKGFANVRFSKSGKGNDVFQDVLDGIRSNVSVGYQIDEVVLEKEEKDKLSTYRVTRWEPYEISMVSIPADISVGIGRSR
jgi:hypothetical protein